MKRPLYVREVAKRAGLEVNRGPTLLASEFSVGCIRKRIKMSKSGMSRDLLRRLLQPKDN